MATRLGVTGLKKTRVVYLLDLLVGRIPLTINPSQQSLSTIPFTNPSTPQASTSSTTHYRTSLVTLTTISNTHPKTISCTNINTSSSTPKLTQTNHATTSTTTTSIFEPGTFPKHPSSKKKSSIKKSSRITITKGRPPTLDIFLSIDTWLKRQKKYSLPFKHN